MFNLHQQCLRNQGYEPLDLLGQGSFSSVYTVQDLRTKHLKAVKIIENQQLTTTSLTKLNDDHREETESHKKRSILELRRKKLRERRAGQKYFNREIITLKRLIQSYHPSIVKIFAIKKTFLYTYIFMEHLSKGNLNDYLNKNGPLEPDDDLAKSWIYQLASALDKLQNIGLTEDLDAKLIDFGFACKCVINKINPRETGDLKSGINNNQLDDSINKSSNLRSFDSNLGVNLKNLDTQSSFLSEKLSAMSSSNYQKAEKIIQLSNSQCGTPLYIPPEVIIADKCPYDPRKADVWSLGVSMFAIISYRYPFTKRDYKVLYRQQLKRSWMTKRVYTCFSEDAFDLIKYMLEPMPKKRYTATQILQHNWIRKFLKNKNYKSDLKSESSLENKLNKLTELTDQIDLNKQIGSGSSSESENSEIGSIISYESNQVSQSILSTRICLDSQSCI